MSTYFGCKCITELLANTIPDHLEGAIADIEKKLDFIRLGSGWVLEKVHHIEVMTAKYQPLAANTYIRLPEKLAAKKAVVNIQNFEDDQCLVWSLLAAKMNVHWKDHPERVAHYQSHEHEIKLGDVQCPVSVTKIEKI